MELELEVCLVEGFLALDDYENMTYVYEACSISGIEFTNESTCQLDILANWCM